MAATLRLTTAIGVSDRVFALFDGRIQPKGIELNFIRESLDQIFYRMLRYREFDVSELSLAGYTMLRSRGVTEMVAIPVFPSRMFRHSSIYVRAGSPVQRPQDLADRRIGVPDYTMTAAVWVRAMLASSYGVDPRSVRWRTGGLDAPGRKPRFPFVAPPGFQIEPIDPSATLSQLLLDDEIDGIVAPRMPAPFADGSGRVKRLFDDPRSAEIAYYRETGIFPIMHTVVIKREIYDRHPWVARELFNAFSAAKAAAQRELHDTDHLFASVVWLPVVLEEQRAVLGADYWPYGVGANRQQLIAFIEACAAQGLLERPVAVDDLFAETTLES